MFIYDSHVKSIKFTSLKLNEIPFCSLKLFILNSVHSFILSGVQSLKTFYTTYANI